MAEIKFTTKSKIDYFIDPENFSVSKINRKGEKQYLTYNDISKIFIDFQKISLTAQQIQNTKKYLIEHPFTTFLFCGFSKEKFPETFTIEQVVEKLSKKNDKLLGTYFLSVLLLQNEKMPYDELLKASDKPDHLQIKIDTFKNYYLENNLKTIGFFPSTTLNDFLVQNEAIYRNSSSVEQTLKLINLDPASELYKNTSAIWSNYLLGKNSQLSFKQAFPILNLTCTYSLYKINFKDKAFEAKLSSLKSSAPHNEVSRDYIVSSPVGRELYDQILSEKLRTNPALEHLPHIKEYLTKTFDLNNYMDDSSAEKEKMTNWLMKYENSSNRAAYSVEVSEILKHNVDHAISKIQFLTENQGKELLYKPAIPQELQKFCTSGLSRNAQTPKIYEQVKAKIASPDLSLNQKIDTINFFNTLNKAAIKEFAESPKDRTNVQLPEVFSRYFSTFNDYIEHRQASLKEVSEMFVMLIAKKDELPAWILKDGFISSNNNRRLDGFGQLKDNLELLRKVDDFIKLQPKEIYKQIFNNNIRNINISKYYDELVNGKSPSQLKYYDNRDEYDSWDYQVSDYNFYKFFKNLKLDKHNPDWQENLQVEVGKFVADYCNLNHSIETVKAAKSIKNVTSEQLTQYTSCIDTIKRSLNDLINEKNQEKKTVQTYLTEMNTGLFGEALEKQLDEHPMELNHKNQVIHEDEHYRAFIPSFKEVVQWAKIFNNCMATCGSYLPSYKKGYGLFVFIERKENGTVFPLNATHLTYSRGRGTSHGTSYGSYYSGSDPINLGIVDVLKHNKAIKDKKSPKFGQPAKKIFSNLFCDQCFNRALSISSQPLIHALETPDHKSQVQTPKQREQLYTFCKEMIKKTGFDGCDWFKDFDKVMEKYYAEKKAKAK